MHKERQVQGRRGMRGGPEEQTRKHAARMRHASVTAADMCPQSGKQSRAGPRKPAAKDTHQSTHQEIITPQRKKTGRREGPTPGAQRTTQGTPRSKRPKSPHGLTRQTAEWGTGKGAAQRGEHAGHTGRTRRAREGGWAHVAKRKSRRIRKGEERKTKPLDERWMTRAAATLPTKHDAAQ